jgi:hypothetical protein
MRCRAASADTWNSGMSRTKCASCGLINFASSPHCRRCGVELLAPEPAIEPLSGPAGHSRSVGRWVFWILSVTVTILLTCYVSLLATSQRLSPEERQAVVNAVNELANAGFSRESFVLRHLVSYRRTDNWWNQYVGHQTAYAATNFPFGVVTLYPTFFRYPVDDVERATILLHEFSHVFGGREEEALRRVWIEKHRLGWTADRYSHTRVWKNTREWTVGSVPTLFRCGPDRQSDCLQ